MALQAVAKYRDGLWNKRDLRACSTRVENPSFSGTTSPSVRCQKSFGHRRLYAHLINQRAENSLKSEGGHDWVGGVVTAVD